jgi:hypothetical protein
VVSKDLAVVDRRPFGFARGGLRPLLRSAEWEVYHSFAFGAQVVG